MGMTFGVGLSVDFCSLVESKTFSDKHKAVISDMKPMKYFDQTKHRKGGSLIKISRV